MKHAGILLLDKHISIASLLITFRFRLQMMQNKPSSVYCQINYLVKKVLKTFGAATFHSSNCFFFQVFSLFMKHTKHYL